MLESIVKYIQLHNNLFWTIVGSILGYFIPKVFDYVNVLFGRKYREFKQKKISNSLDFLEKEINVEILNTGNEPYRSNAINIIETGNSFYLPVPDDILLKLQEKYKSDSIEFFEFFEIHEQILFDNETTIDKLSKKTGIENLEQLIDEARYEVAYEFLNSKNGLYFNASKYGVWNIDFTSKFGKGETRHLSLELFNTDYYTHKVMQNVYSKIYKKYKIDEDITPEKLHKYNIFLTSFGVNALLLLKDKKMGDICVFAERSILASGTDKSNIYHITMNEGLNQDDKDAIDGKIRLSNCLERGLWEELGLNNDYYAQDMTADFHDLFLVKDKFQLGISVSVFIKDMSFNDLYAQAEIAKDKKLEIGKLKPIIFDKKHIEKFFTENSFTSYSRFIVSRICFHKGIFIDFEKIIKK